MNFRPTCFKNFKEGAPFRRENTHLGQVHDSDMDVTLTSKRRLPRGPGVLQASRERGAPGPPLQDRPLSLPVPGADGTAHWDTMASRTWGRGRVYTLPFVHF